jgi:hypothetical protein
LENAFDAGPEEADIEASANNPDKKIDHACWRMLPG